MISFIVFQYDLLYISGTCEPVTAMSPVFNNIGACEPVTAMSSIDYNLHIHYIMHTMLILQVAAWDLGAEYSGPWLPHLW